MDFIEQVGTHYLEGKAYAAPQQLENLAKKQFHNSRKASSKAGSQHGHGSTTDEHEESDEHSPVSRKGASMREHEHEHTHAGDSEKDLEIARLREELEESRRGARHASPTPSKKERREKREEHKLVASKESPSHALRKSRSTKFFDNNGIRIVGGALVADAASRRHREKRPEHGATRGLGKTVDGKGVGVAGGALVAERGHKTRSKSEHAAKEPIIVEAAPRPRLHRRQSSDEEDEEDSEKESVAHSMLSRRSRHRSRKDEEEEEAMEDHRSKYGSPARISKTRRVPRQLSPEGYDDDEDEWHGSEHGSLAPSRASHSRHSFADRSEHGSIALSRTSTRRHSPDADPPPSRRKSILASRGRRPSTESAVGSVIAPPAQVEAIRRRQRSRGRGLADAAIDTPAPETPSLRALSRRRRETETRHERGSRRDEEEAAHLPERRKSVLHERVGGKEGSVIDVLEARSVPFRPHRQQGKGGSGEKERRREREMERGMVEVMEERQRGPTVRRIDMGQRAERASEVELMRREGGRSVYRVR